MVTVYLAGYNKVTDNCKIPECDDHKSFYQKGKV